MISLKLLKTVLLASVVIGGKIDMENQASAEESVLKERKTAASESNGRLRTAHLTTSKLLSTPEQLPLPPTDQAEKAAFRESSRKLSSLEQHVQRQELRSPRVDHLKDDLEEMATESSDVVAASVSYAETEAPPAQFGRGESLGALTVRTSEGNKNVGSNVWKSRRPGAARDGNTNEQQLDPALKQFKHASNKTATESAMDTTSDEESPAQNSRFVWAVGNRGRASGWDLKNGGRQDSWTGAGTEGNPGVNVGGWNGGQQAWSNNGRNGNPVEWDEDYGDGEDWDEDAGGGNDGGGEWNVPHNGYSNGWNNGNGQGGGGWYSGGVDSGEWKIYDGDTMDGNVNTGWKVVGSGDEGWNLVNDKGMIEWKIEYVDGEWKVISAEELHHRNKTEPVTSVTSQPTVPTPATSTNSPLMAFTTASPVAAVTTADMAAVITTRPAAVTTASAASAATTATSAAAAATTATRAAAAVTTIASSPSITASSAVPVATTAAHNSVPAITTLSVPTTAAENSGKLTTLPIISLAALTEGGEKTRPATSSAESKNGKQGKYTVWNPNGEGGTQIYAPDGGTAVWPVGGNNGWLKGGVPSGTGVASKPGMQPDGKGNLVPVSWNSQGWYPNGAGGGGSIPNNGQRWVGGRNRNGRRRRKGRRRIPKGWAGHRGNGGGKNVKANRRTGGGGKRWSATSDNGVLLKNDVGNRWNSGGSPSGNGQKWKSGARSAGENAVSWNTGGSLWTNSNASNTAENGNGTATWNGWKLNGRNGNTVWTNNKGTGIPYIIVITKPSGRNSWKSVETGNVTADNATTKGDGSGENPWKMGRGGNSGWQWNANRNSGSWKWLDGWMGSGGGFGGWTKGKGAMYTNWKPIKDGDNSQTENDKTKKSASKMVFVYKPKKGDEDWDKTPSTPTTDEKKSASKQKQVIIIDYTGSGASGDAKDDNAMKKNIESIIKTLKSAKPTGIKGTLPAESASWS